MKRRFKRLAKLSECFIAFRWMWCSIRHGKSTRTVVDGSERASISRCSCGVWFWKYNGHTIATTERLAKGSIRMFRQHRREMAELLSDYFSRC